MEDIVDRNTLFGPLPAASADLAVEALLELMETQQVRAACTPSTPGIWLAPSLGNGATRAAWSEKHQLIPVATLNPAMFMGDAPALAQFVSDGFRLLPFSPAFQRWHVDFAPL